MNRLINIEKSSIHNLQYIITILYVCFVYYLSKKKNKILRYKAIFNNKK